jgi:hypothetical protein
VEGRPVFAALRIWPPLSLCRRLIIRETQPGNGIKKGELEREEIKTFF